MLHRSSRPAAIVTTVLAGLVATATAADVALAQQPSSAALAQAPRSAASAAARAAPARPAEPRAESQPTWAELTRQQQASLAPLAATWHQLDEGHKRKWLALSANYPEMSGGEQARLHTRMAEWAALSPRQRALARLNFGEAQRVDVEDKRARWEAYQSLSPEEKARLAAGAAAEPAPPPTAVAPQPVPPQKLTRLPGARKESAGMPVVPGKVDHNTLLPQPPSPTGP